MTDAVLRLILGAQFQPTIPVRLVLAFLVWAVAALAVYGVLSLLKQAGRRTRSDIDDLLIAESRTPLIVLVMLAGAYDVLAPLAVPPGVPTIIERVLLLGVKVSFVWAAAWLGVRLGAGVVLRWAASASERTESTVDDMLMPLTRTLIRPVAIGAAAVLSLQVIGLPIASIALLVGGLSFILAFAMQSTLEDIFGGVSLIVDTPFTYGDVLELEDGSVCEVQGLGLRVTRLYHARNHAVVLIPNRELAGQKIVNLTRPSPDMRLSICASVPDSIGSAEVRNRMVEAANAHPWVLGNTEAKLAAMRRRAIRLVWTGRLNDALLVLREMGRIDAEGAANRAIEDLETHLVEFASRVHYLESGAFDANEQIEVDDGLAQLLGLVNEVRRTLTVWLLTVRRTYVVLRDDFIPTADTAELMADVAARRAERDVAAPDDLAAIGEAMDERLRRAVESGHDYRAICETLVDAALSGASSGHDVCLLGDITPSQAFFAFQAQETRIAEAGFGAGLANRSRGGIPDLDEAEEFLDYWLEWNTKFQRLQRRVKGLFTERHHGSGMLLDEGLFALRQWLADEFKEPTPEWKYPSVSLVSFTDGCEYELRAYVDNVKLSHFTRASKTSNALRLDILHLFREIDPVIPFGNPGMDVNLPAELFTAAAN